MLEPLLTPDGLIALLTLTALEIVLGIDNIVFISILVAKLPEAERDCARRIGIALALVTRIALLFTISWVMGLTKPLFTVLSKDISGRDLILLLGGAFLVAKATNEIYEKLEVEEHTTAVAARSAFVSVVAQIALLDIVFSLDSVITAVGMVKELVIMIVAVVIAVAIMLAFSGSVARFIDRHPSMKVLALAFLILIGVVLAAEGLGQHVSKGYIYSAMAFSLFVELLNMRFRKRQSPVHLHGPHPDEVK